MTVGVGVHTQAFNGAAANLTTAGVNTTTGSTLLLGICFDSVGATVTFTSVTDSLGNLWVQKEPEVILDFGNKPARVFICENATGGVGHTFTLTVSGSTIVAIYVQEVTGAAISSYNVSASVNDTATPFNSPGITTTQAAELLWTMIFGNGAATTYVEGGAFTIQDQQGTTAPSGAQATRIVAATGTYNSSFTDTSSTNTAVFIIGVKAKVVLVTVQPQDQRVYAGQVATFTITAVAAAGALHYQWKDDGVNVGTDSATYAPTAALSDDGSIITCVVTDDEGSITSQDAHLFVAGTAALMWIGA